MDVKSPAPPAGRPVRRWWTPARPGPASRVSVGLLTALFLLALAGRFSPDRLGLPTYGVSDLRVPGCLLLVLGALAWYAKGWSRGRRPSWPPPMVLLFVALIGVQLVSALWSPPGARLDKAAWDLVALLILVVAAAVLSAGDPARSARVLLVLMLGAAIVYTVGALAVGPGDQGRYSAFGGGPNVFVRVVCLGIIGAVTLARLRRRWLLLLPLPLLVSGAVLSGSRGGLVSLVAAGVAFVVLFPRRVRITYLLTVVAVVTLSAWTVSTLADDGWQAMSENRYSVAGVQEGGFSSRLMLISQAWSLFVDHPVSGGGLDSYHATFGIVYPHNYLLALAAESGVVAVALFLAAAVRFWRDGRPWSAAPREQVGCAVAAIYIAVASNFSGDYFDTRFFWILAVVALLRAPDQPGRGDPPVRQRRVRTAS